MFATYEPFKFPLQFNDDSTIWRGVEIMLSTPWLIATLDTNEKVARTFLLEGPDDLLQILHSPGLGRLAAVRLVLPPAASPTGDWSFVSIDRVERELRSTDRIMPSAILKSSDGQRYGSFPIQHGEWDDADLVLLIDLSVARP